MVILTPGSWLLAPGGSDAIRTIRQHSPRGRSQRKPAGLGGDPRATGAKLGAGCIRPGGPEMLAAPGLRGDPARRSDAGHGWVRDRRADPRPRALATYADHLFDGHQHERYPHLARLRAWRGR